MVLLEPIMRLEITTPEEYFGDFVSDLQQRRGTITQTHQRGNKTVIEAHAPLANLFGYSSAMREPEPGPRHLHHGARRLRPRPAGSAAVADVAVSLRETSVASRCRSFAHSLRRKRQVVAMPLTYRGAIRAT